MKSIADRGFWGLPEVLAVAGALLACAEATPDASAPQGGSETVTYTGGWSYTWSCTGECAPGNLAISGRSGVFATEDECNAARDVDPMKETVLASGNFGNVDFCRQQ